MVASAPSTNPASPMLTRRTRPPPTRRHPHTRWSRHPPSGALHPPHRAHHPRITDTRAPHCSSVPSVRPTTPLSSFITPPHLDFSSSVGERFFSLLAPPSLLVLFHTLLHPRSPSLLAPSTLSYTPSPPLASITIPYHHLLSPTPQHIPSFLSSLYRFHPQTHSFSLLLEATREWYPFSLCQYPSFHPLPAFQFAAISPQRRCHDDLSLMPLPWPVAPFP
jgi:hypothetical protein